MNPVIEHLTQGTLEVTGRLVDASNATLYAMCSVKDDRGDFGSNVEPS